MSRFAVKDKNYMGLICLHISPTIAYDYPTLAKQVEYIDGLIQGKQQHVKKHHRSFKHEPIAIIGMACRFPGNADQTEEFWNNLLEGKDGLEEVPANRWDINDYYDPDRKKPGKMVTRKGGFISGIDQFDANFFHISPKEAELLDPNQRIALETAWHAIEDARIDPKTLMDTSTGVFMGVMFHDYDVLLEKAGLTQQPLSYLNLGTSQGAVAGRISYSLGLQGPSMVIDTACSSSLTVLHEACQHLRNDECNLALAGGVNLMLLPEVSIGFSQANMLSPDGSCKSFSDDANGYVRSEGCGVVVLKKLKSALRDGDRILAVIKGSAVNQDGASSGMTAPNRLAQQDLLAQALAMANVSPNDIDYIEAHGTGTPLGDPIEIGAIEQVYQGRDKTLYIGSVKSNIGHLEAAAGMAGLMTVILSLKHECIPANLHFRALNPRIHLDTIPAKIPTMPIAWKKTDKPRRAEINSFGFTGTNVHVIVEEAPYQEGAQLRPERAKTVFNRKRYWADVLTHKKETSVLGQEIHPLLGVHLLEAADSSSSIYEQSLTSAREDVKYLADHKVYEQVVYPGAGYIELLIHALKQGNDGPVEIKAFSIERPLVLSTVDVKIQVVLNKEKVAIYSKNAEEWQLHSQAIACETLHLYAMSDSLSSLEQRITTAVDMSDFYSKTKANGIDYGPSFQVIEQAKIGTNEALVYLKSNAAYAAILDGGFQGLGLLVKDGRQSQRGDGGSS